MLRKSNRKLFEKLGLEEGHIHKTVQDSGNSCAVWWLRTKEFPQYNTGLSRLILGASGVYRWGIYGG